MIVFLFSLLTSIFEIISLILLILFFSDSLFVCGPSSLFELLYIVLDSYILFISSSIFLSSVIILLSLTLSFKLSSLFFKTGNFVGTITLLTISPFALFPKFMRLIFINISGK